MNSIEDSVDHLMRKEESEAKKTYDGLAEGPVISKIMRVYRRIDDLMNASANLIACKQGCDYCCHYHVYVTPAEVFAIAEEIEKMPSSQKQGLEESIRTYVNQVKGMGREQHIRTNIACVFLKNGSCSIYKLRPLACRRHHSGDVGVCQRTFDNVQSDELAPKDPFRTVVSTAMENLHALMHMQAGLDSDSYEFHAALLEALTNKASFKRWKNEKSAFPSVVDKSRLIDAINGK